MVWAHNSHLGDARATQMGARGELNVGQLVSEKYGARARLIGFTTHTGTVTAAHDWNDLAERGRSGHPCPGATSVCSTTSAFQNSGSCSTHPTFATFSCRLDWSVPLA